MRLRRIPGIEERIAADFPRLVVADAERYKGRWDQYFGRRRPLSLEIGMGRGQFLNELRLREPENDFIAVEMRNEVIYAAAEKFGDDCPNVAVISDRAEYLEYWFGEGEVERIFLNFSDPWPKRAHRKRRLTHENYLRLYRKALTANGEIFLRTDAASLMEFSLTEMTNNGFFLKEVSLDFHNSPYFDGVTTEYEDKKSAEGPIYYGRFSVMK